MKRKFNIKQLLRPLMGLGIGALVGVACAASLFAVPVIREFLKGPMSDSGILVFMLYWFAAMALMVVTVYMQIIIHEAGHLVGGLLSGYGFVSFRVFNIVLVRRNDGWHFGRFSVAGTVGQCLMEPAGEGLDDAVSMPYRLYLASGVAANAVVAVASVAVLCLCGVGVFWSCLLVMLALSGAYLAIVNGIPMKVAGVANDGYSIRIMGDDVEARRLLWVQLKANALYVRGLRYSDMPDEWFVLGEGGDLSNYLYATIVGMRAGRTVEQRDFSAAYDDLMSLRRADGLIELLRMEAACEMLLPAVLLHRPRTEIERIMGERELQYARSYAEYMISRAITVYVWERFVERRTDRRLKAAERIRKMASRYPTLGEATVAVELLDYMENLNDEDYAVD